MNKSVLLHIALFLFLIHFKVSGQKNSDNRNRLYNEAENAFYNENFRYALSLYQKLDSLEPNNPYCSYFLGSCYLFSKANYSKAIKYLEFAARELPESDIIYQVYFNLGKAYHLNNRFDEAIEYYGKVISGDNLDTDLIREAKRQIELCNNAKKIVQNPVKVTIENMGSKINSEYSEHSPVITADESMLLFTSKRKGNTGNLKDEDGMYYEDIYMSQKNENNEWRIAENVGEPINTNQYDATIALSVDGEKLFLYRGGRQAGGDGIFVSDKKGKYWSEPVRLGRTINSGNAENCASISSDGRTLYFTSKRKGGYGGKDIYKSELMDNGEWGQAINLGSTINTEFDEESPFIHADNKTLYFSSKGHNSMGGFDIFKSVMIEDQWSSPENMGYPINTSADDVHFIVSAKGERAYYASAKAGGFGEEDLYVIILPKTNIPLTMIRGTIITNEKKPLKVKIKIIDKETNNLVKHVYNPNPETGKYLMIFPPGKNYQMVVEAEGYFPYAFDLYIPNQTYFYELYQTMYLKAVAPFDETIGQGISIENTFYDVHDSSDQEKASAARDSLLLSLIDQIIENSDSSKLANLDDYASDSTKNYSPLTSLVETIIEYTDSFALENLEKITQQGFLEKADENTFFYGKDKNVELQPFKVGNDTIYIIPPTVSEASSSLSFKDSIPSQQSEPVKEKVDEISIQTVLNSRVLFESNRPIFKTEYFETLDKVVEMLKTYPNLKAEITGHSDSQGQEKFNLALSKQRAESVREYLISNGIDKSRIMIMAMGESHPVESNKTEKGRQANRRAEIRLIETSVKQKIIR